MSLLDKARLLYEEVIEIGDCSLIVKKDNQLKVVYVDKNSGVSKFSEGFDSYTISKFDNSQITVTVGDNKWSQRHGIIGIQANTVVPIQYSFMSMNRNGVCIAKSENTFLNSDGKTRCEVKVDVFNKTGILVLHTNITKGSYCARYKVQIDGTSRKIIIAKNNETGRSTVIDDKGNIIKKASGFTEHFVIVEDNILIKIDTLNRACITAYDFSGNRIEYTLKTFKTIESEVNYGNNFSKEAMKMYNN